MSQNYYDALMTQGHRSLDECDYLYAVDHFNNAAFCAESPEQRNQANEYMVEAQFLASVRPEVLTDSAQLTALAEDALQGGNPRHSAYYFRAAMRLESLIDLPVARILYFQERLAHVAHAEGDTEGAIGFLMVVIYDSDLPADDPLMVSAKALYQKLTGQEP